MSAKQLLLAEKQTSYGQFVNRSGRKYILTMALLCLSAYFYQYCYMSRM